MGNWNLYAWKYPESDKVYLVNGISRENALDLSNRITAANTDTDVYLSPCGEVVRELFEGSDIRVVPENELTAIFII